VSDDRRSALEVLGLTAGAGDEEIVRAYRRRAALYHRDSLATYSLMSDEERSAKLAQLERAYRNLVSPELDADAVEAADDTAAAAMELPPDPVRAPGAYLRHHRLAEGYDLAQVTLKTKIRTAVLEDLEAERFDRLPAEVYVRGFVIQLARLLGIPDPEALASHYLSRLSSGRPSS